MAGTHCCDPQTPSVRAVLKNTGLFTKGYAVALTLSVADQNGTAVNASNVSVVVRDSDGDNITFKTPNSGARSGDELNPEQVGTGMYFYQWYIDDDIDAGTYTVVWTYKIDDVEYSQMEEVVVVEDGVTTAIYDDRMRSMRNSLRHVLSCATKVPIYGEQAKPSSDCKTFYFTRPNWNQSPSQTRIYRNNHTILTSGLTIDYESGKVILDEELSQSESISADYNYSWFSDEDLTDYINGAIQIYNHSTPFSAYDYRTLPEYAVRGVIYKAATDAIRELLMCLMMPEPQQLFGGYERAQQIAGQMETLKKNFEGDWKWVFEQKKYGPYPSMKIVTVPSYTLPGGRSRWFRYLFAGGSG